LHAFNGACLTQIPIQLRLEVLEVVALPVSKMIGPMEKVGCERLVTAHETYFYRRVCHYHFVHCFASSVLFIVLQQ